MFIATEDSAKRRLTEPLEILTAVSILQARGVNRDQIILEMSKIFYVDLDEFDRLFRKL